MNSNKNLHNSLAKKLLLATLAATSTLTALDASAKVVLQKTGQGDLSVGTNMVKDKNVALGGYAAGPGPAAAGIAPGDNIYLGSKHGLVLNVAPALPVGPNPLPLALGTINAYGNKATLTVAESISVSGLINTTADADAKAVEDLNGSPLQAGKDAGEQITVQFNAANKIFEVTGKDVSGLFAVDFANQDSIFRISGQDTAITDKVSFKSNGGNEGTVEINATGVSLEAKFSDTPSTLVKKIKVNDNKTATQKVDVKLSGSLELDKSATYNIDAGKTFEGAGAGAVTFLDATSILNLKGENTIKGNVGANEKLGVVTHTGKNSTIDGDVKVKSLQLNSQDEGALIITGKLDENTKITAKGSAKLELTNTSSSITPFIIESGSNTTTQTEEQKTAEKTLEAAEKDVQAKATAAKDAQDALKKDTTSTTAAQKDTETKNALAEANKKLDAAKKAKEALDKAATTATTATVVLNATGDFTTTDTLTQNVHFKNDTAVLKVKEEKQLRGVTTETKDTGQVKYLGDAVISANIGADNKALQSIETEKEKGKITIDENIHVYAKVLLTKKEQTLTIGKGALVSSVYAKAGTEHVVDVKAGASLGDVGGATGTTTGTVNFTGGGKFIGKDYVASNFNLSKGPGEAVFLVTQDNTTFTNLRTEKDVTIDANGNKLTFAPDSTIANNTTLIAEGTNLKLALVNGALNVKDQEEKNIGQTNIIIDFEKVGIDLKLLSDSYEKLTDKEKNKSGQPIKLITGLKDEEVSKKFTLKENLSYKLNVEFKDGELTIDPTFNSSMIDNTPALSINDETKPFSKQGLELINLIGEIGTDKALQYYSAMDDKTGGAIAINNIQHQIAQNIFTSASNQLNQALAAGGENYNEMGVTAFVAPFMSSGTSKLNGQVAGNKHSSSGANFGATFGLNEDKTHFGLAVTIAKSDTKYKDAQEGNKLKSDTKAFTIFANHAFANNLVVQGIFTFGATDHKASQLLKDKDKPYSGKYSSKFSSVLAKLGYNMNAGDSVKVMPYVGLRYDSIKDDSHKLATNEAVQENIATREVSGKTANSCIASIGTKFSGQIEYDETNLVPFADLSFGYNFGKKASAKEVALGNLSITPEYATQDKSSISASIGAEANMKNGLNVTVMGGMDMLGSKTNVYSGSLKLGYKF